MTERLDYLRRQLESDRDRSTCWEWPFNLNGGGYGQLTFNHRTQVAHRVAFFLVNGHWPYVCRHTCDNPPCFNPDHLVNGTDADNYKDWATRGTSPNGPSARMRRALHEPRERNVPPGWPGEKLLVPKSEIATVYGLSLFRVGELIKVGKLKVTQAKPRGIRELVTVESALRSLGVPTDDTADTQEGTEG